MSQTELEKRLSDMEQRMRGAKVHVERAKEATASGAALALKVDAVRINLRFALELLAEDGRPCPFCGFRATDTQMEVEHMEANHPDVIVERLHRAGL